jgi:rhamnosyl/mannosyltransferase
MKILHIVKSYFPKIGGIETVSRQLAEGAAKRGHEVSVLCCGNKKDCEGINGVRVYSRKPILNVGSAPISSGFFFDFINMMKDYDVLHFHVPNPIGELAFCLTPKKAQKVLCTYHLDPVRPKAFVTVYKKLLNRFLKSCDVICPTSPNYVESSDVLNCFKEKCNPIALGVDVARFANVASDKKTEAEYLVKDLKHPRVLFCGRFSYYKGLSFLVDAVSRIPDCSLILVGNGEKKEELEKQIANLGIKDRVVMLGHLSDELYPAIYYTADMFVLPSIYRSEAFALVGLEAMAASLPLVTTEIGTGTSYYNIDGETGYVVPPMNSEVLAQTIQKFIDKPEEAKKMAKVARQRVQYFGVSQMV